MSGPGAVKEPGKTRAGFMPTSRTGGEATASGGEDKASSQGPWDTLLPRCQGKGSQAREPGGQQHREERSLEIGTSGSVLGGI